MGCNTCQKVLGGVGGVTILAAIIVVIISVVGMGNAGNTHEWEVTGSSVSFTVEHIIDTRLILIEESHSANCDNLYQQVSDKIVSSPADMTFHNKKCKPPDAEQAKQFQDAYGKVFYELMEVGTSAEDVTVTISNAPVHLYVWHGWGQVGEAVGGFFANMGLMIVAIILAIAACICFCVICCVGDKGTQ